MIQSMTYGLTFTTNYIFKIVRILFSDFSSEYTQGETRRGQNKSNLDSDYFIYLYYSASYNDWNELVIHTACSWYKNIHHH